MTSTSTAARISSPTPTPMSTVDRFDPVSLLSGISCPELSVDVLVTGVVGVSVTSGVGDGVGESVGLGGGVVGATVGGVVTGVVGTTMRTPRNELLARLGSG